MSDLPGDTGHSVLEPPPFLPDTSHAADTDDVEAIILGLAAQEATGCLTILNARGDEGLVWLRDGQVYSVSVPGRRPLLGVRLVTGGAISPEQLHHALEIQRTQMMQARLGEVLVQLGLVNRRVIESFVLEQQRDMLADLLGWQVTSQWFRNGARTRTDLAPFLDVADLIEQARVRQATWPAVVDEIGGLDVVPLTTGAAPQADLSSSERVVLNLVNGVRSLTDIADACGYTTFEAADVLLGLAAAGLVTTATDLLHDPRPVTDLGSREMQAPLAEVLPLHIVHDEPEPEPEADAAWLPEPEPEADAAWLPEPEPEADAAWLPEPEPEPATSFSFSQQDTPAPALDEAPIGLAGSPFAPQTYEPAVTAQPTPYSALPPPSAGPLPSFEPLEEANLPSFEEAGAPFLEAPATPAPAVPPAPRRVDSDEPTDTAALLRELSSLGFDDSQQ